MVSKSFHNLTEKIRLFWRRKKIKEKLVDLDRDYISKPKKSKCKGYCEYCNKKIYEATGYYCKYCKKWHCSKHRLSENHKCEGNPKKPGDML